MTNLFPRQFDNAYRGGRIAIALLVLVTFVKTAMGLNVMFNTRTAAVSADGMPLERYGELGAEAVLTFFALWGLGQVILAAMSAIALVRYRSMIPLIFLVLLCEQLGRKLIFSLNPLEGSGTTAALLINLAFLVVLVVGLLNSLVPRAGARAQISQA